MALESPVGHLSGLLLGPVEVHPSFANELFGPLLE